MLIGHTGELKFGREPPLLWKFVCLFSWSGRRLGIITNPGVCNSLSLHFIFIILLPAWQNQNQITEITDRFKVPYTSANFVF